MKRTGFLNRGKPLARAAFNPKTPDQRPKRMKTAQLAVTADERDYWGRLASKVGCIACIAHGHFNPYVSIHHIDGRTKPGCHMLVLPLCAGHHQDGTGEDKSLLAVHPWKARFEARYGAQLELKAKCDYLLELIERTAA